MGNKDLPGIPAESINEQDGLFFFYHGLLITFFQRPGPFKEVPNARRRFQRFAVFLIQAMQLTLHFGNELIPIFGKVAFVFRFRD